MCALSLYQLMAFSFVTESHGVVSVRVRTRKRICRSMWDCQKCGTVLALLVHYTCNCLVYLHVHKGILVTE